MNYQREDGVAMLAIAEHQAVNEKAFRSVTTDKADEAENFVAGAPCRASIFEAVLSGSRGIGEKRLPGVVLFVEG